MSKTFSDTSNWEFTEWEKAGVGLCVSLANALVLYQNRICEITCGIQRGFVCRPLHFRPCKSKRIRGRFGGGCYKFESDSANGKEFATCTVNDLKQVTTLFYPLAEKRKREEEFFSCQNLSKQESKIVNLLLGGSTRQQIGEILGVSPNTVKWHIRNIYRKVSSTAKQLLRNRSIEGLGD